MNKTMYLNIKEAFEKYRNNFDSLDEYFEFLSKSLKKVHLKTKLKNEYMDFGNADINYYLYNDLPEWIKSEVVNDILFEDIDNTGKKEYVVIGNEHIFKSFETKDKEIESDFLYKVWNQYRNDISEWLTSSQLDVNIFCFEDEYEMFLEQQIFLTDIYISDLDIEKLLGDKNGLLNHINLIDESFTIAFKVNNKELSKRLKKEKYELFKELFLKSLEVEEYQMPFHRIKEITGTTRSDLGCKPASLFGRDNFLSKIIKESGGHIYIKIDPKDFI